MIHIYISHMYNSSLYVYFIYYDIEMILHESWQNVLQTIKLDQETLFYVQCDKG